MNHKRIAPSEITVRDGHLTIKLGQMHDGWYAIIESDIEGKIFEGRVTELSELLAGHDYRESGEIAGNEPSPQS